MPSLKFLKDKGQDKLASAPQGSKREKLLGHLKKDGEESSSSSSSSSPASALTPATASTPSAYSYAPSGGTAASVPPPAGYAYPPPAGAYPPVGYAPPPTGYAYPPPAGAYPLSGYAPPHFATSAPVAASTPPPVPSPPTSDSPSTTPSSPPSATKEAPPIEESTPIPSQASAPPPIESDSSSDLPKESAPSSPSPLVEDSTTSPQTTSPPSSPSTTKDAPVTNNPPSDIPSPPSSPTPSPAPMKTLEITKMKYDLLAQTCYEGDVGVAVKMMNSLKFDQFNEDNLLQFINSMDRTLKSRDKKANQAGFVALRINAPLVFAALLKSKMVDLSLRNQHDNNLVELAIASKNPNFFEQLKGHYSNYPDFDINDTMADGWTTPFHLAINNRDVEALKYLVDEWGANPNPEPKPNSVSPLILACAEGNPETALYLLEKGADPNDRLLGETSCLHFVSEHGYHDVMKELVKRAADINYQEPTHKKTALYHCVMEEKEKSVKWLVEMGADIDLPNGNGNSPLIASLFFSLHDTALLLLKKGASLAASEHAFRQGNALFMALTAGDTINQEVFDILVERNIKEKTIDWEFLHNGNTVVSVAAEMDDTYYLEELLEAGANPSPSGTVYSPFYKAVMLKNDEALALLIEHGATLVPLARKTDTMLHFAAREGLEKTAKALIVTKKFDVDVKNGFNQTPFQVAKAYGKMGIIRVLLENGATLPRPTPAPAPVKDLYYAAKNGLVDLARTLLDSKTCEINACDHTGKTPLMWATFQQKNEMVKFLLENNADPTIAMKDGQTCLHFAVECDKLELVKLFFDATKFSVDLDKRNFSGANPLHAACICASKPVVEYLIEKGSDPNSKTSKGFTCRQMAKPNPNPGVREFFM